MAPEMLAWADVIRPAWDHTETGAPVLTHRKIWEWVYIIEALHGRSLLEPGRRGLGFGVGRDPLAALFAREGCAITATDLDVGEAEEGGWVDSGQHASKKDELNAYGICDPARFAEEVHFQTVDMRYIPPDLRDFDFTWSACALEHLGSLAAGHEFLMRQMDCLRPGGVAVHTTEFNVSSNRSTLGRGHTVLYRRRDIDLLVRDLRRHGHVIEVSYDTGSAPADLHVDRPPWPGPHLKIGVESFVTTSLALVIVKGPADAARSWSPGPEFSVRRAAQGVEFAALSRSRHVYERLKALVRAETITS